MEILIIREEWQMVISLIQTLRALLSLVAIHPKILIEKFLSAS